MNKFRITFNSFRLGSVKKLHFVLCCRCVCTLFEGNNVKQQQQKNVDYYYFARANAGKRILILIQCVKIHSFDSKFQWQSYRLLWVNCIYFFSVLFLFFIDHRQLVVLVEELVYAHSPIKLQLFIWYYGRYSKDHFSTIQSQSILLVNRFSYSFFVRKKK